MKTVLLFRHAKSSWGDSALDDHDRPLNNRGKEDAPRMGRLLADEELVPDFVLCSTAKRARKTAKLALDACGFRGKIDYIEKLYMASDETIVEVLSQAPDDASRVMVIAHNPGMEDLVRRLTAVEQPFPTAALARIALVIHSWSHLKAETKGELIGLWRPKELT